MSETSKTTLHFIGGFSGGLVSSLMLQPFDLIKTRLQQNKNSTLWIVIKGIDSYKQLWRGIFPSCLRTSIGSALYLSSLNLFRNGLADNKYMHSHSSYLPQLSMHKNLISGALTRIFVGFFTMPFTIIKVRYESTMYQYTSLRNALIHIYSTEGIKGFFSGFGATAMRDAPYAGLYVLLYEQSKYILPTLLPKALIEKDEHRASTIYYSAIINSTGAFLSASIATTITAPFDTIKTRMQLDPLCYPNFSIAVHHITKEGTRHFFDGLSLRLIRKAFSAGIAWGIYEELIKGFMSYSH